ncbi:hypothetical protein OV208_00640 [Corallococcus sp. bb12-1]|uniref:hypothetical protein n=1 Tax=Corallococcus sp. bb12-1 TaxID=2996784 RepID=UPI00226F4106|nr:hypothetical protein [Corallococcus sp. bb12-1]MCY1039806.1 hypothetical protein [Corallococcus sp. bb12-1]
MRMTLLLGLLSVGLLAACGGVEPEAQDSDVTGQALPPCELACVGSYNSCMRRATTLAAEDACLERRLLCFDGCGAGAVQPVEALRPPPCQSRCDLLHELCINEAGTPEAQALCDAERKVCKLACVAPAAQPVEAMAVPTCPEICARAYHRCKLLAKTPEDFELCGCWNYQCMDSCVPLSPGSTGTAAYDVTCDG